MLEPILTSEIGRRSIVDVSLAVTAVGTSPWWLTLNSVAQDVLLWGSIFVLIVRLYGMAKDVVRGYRQRRKAEH